MGKFGKYLDEVKKEISKNKSNTRKFLEDNFEDLVEVVEELGTSKMNEVTKLINTIAYKEKVIKKPYEEKDVKMTNAKGEEVIAKMKNYIISSGLIRTVFKEKGREDLLPEKRSKY